jgi:Mg2+ and Co2+ transporter CorA
MIEVRKIGQLQWIDVVMPTHDEARQLISVYGISPEIVDKSILPSVRPDVAHTADTVYTALHVPILERKKNEIVISKDEIDFIVREKDVVTIHYAAYEPLVEFIKILEVNEVTERRKYNHGTDLFFEMLRHIIDSERHIVTILISELERVEKMIFTSKEKKAVRLLSNLARAIQHFKRTFRGQRAALEQINFSSPLFQYIKDEHVRILEDSHLAEEILHEMEDANTAMLHSKEHDSIQILTIVSCTLLLPTFVYDGAHIISSLMTGSASATQITWLIITLSGFATAVYLLLRPKSSHE